MAESIRNQIPGTVKRMISDKAVSEIILETAIGEVAAIITTRSARELELEPGDEVFALIKATNVSLRKEIAKISEDEPKKLPLRKRAGARRARPKKERK
ncbi:MAG: TOBE domain-containing protein [Rhodanobacteraceae bacterium]